MAKNTKVTRTLIAEVKKAQEEVRDLQANLKTGKLDRIKLESGFKQVEKHLKEMSVHTHKIDPC